MGHLHTETNGLNCGYFFFVLLPKYHQRFLSRRRRFQLESIRQWKLLWKKKTIFFPWKQARGNRVSAYWMTVLCKLCPLKSIRVIVVVLPKLAKGNVLMTTLYWQFLRFLSHRHQSDQQSHRILGGTRCRSVKANVMEMQRGNPKATCKLQTE